MRSRLAAFVLAPLLTAISGSVSLAQGIDPQCPTGSFNAGGTPNNAKIAQDACQKAIDLFKYTAPQLGAVLAGGSATQGITGTLGGLGHFSIGLRGNALRASLPEVDRVVPSTRGAQSSSYSLDNKPAGFVTGDLALGIFRGLPLGLTNVGGLDLLVSASYVPNYTRGAFDVTLPGGAWKLGYGGKLGLVQETALIPGVSISFLERELPRVDIAGVSGEDMLFLDSLQVRSRSWRAVAGKSLLFLGVGGGFGQDTYNSNAAIRVSVAPRPTSEGGSGGPIMLTQKLKRNNVFGTVWFTSQVLRIVAEIGRVSGGTVDTFNQFDGPQPADNRTYGSIGFSFGR